MVILKVAGQVSTISTHDDLTLPAGLDLQTDLFNEVATALRHLKRSQEDMDELDPQKTDPDLNLSRCENRLVIFRKRNLLRRLGDAIKAASPSTYADLERKYTDVLKMPEEDNATSGTAQSNVPVAISL